VVQNENSLGVYVHLPWCVTKCPYCDFNSYASTEFPEQRYTDSLLSELAWSAEQVQWRGRKATSVFFGGGTPSLFGADSLAAVLDAIDQHRVFLEASGQLEIRRRHRATTRVREVAERSLRGILWESAGTEELLEAGLDDIGRGTATPYSVSATILAALFGGNAM